MREYLEYTQGEKAEILIFEAINSDTAEKELRKELQTMLNIDFELYDWDMQSISNTLVEYFAGLASENNDEWMNILISYWGDDFWATDCYGNYNLRCDIVLTNKENKDKKVYIEVKSCRENKVEFYLTPNEYEFAKNNSENYYVIHVRNMQEKEKEKWNVEVLPQKFWENERWKVEEVSKNVWKDNICKEKTRYFFSEKM